MGCTSNKQGRTVQDLSPECDNLISLNLLLLRSLQLIYIENRKMHVSIYLVFLQKRTEFYYSSVKKYRKCWQSQIHSRLPDVVYNQQLLRFEKMQNTEKEQLLNCNLILTQALYDVRPYWSEEFPSLSEFLLSLEKKNALLMVLESLYEDFSDVSEKVLVQEIKRYGKFSKKEKKMLDGIVKVTLKYYHEPMNMVYYRESLEVSENFGEGMESSCEKKHKIKQKKSESLKIISSNSSSEASGDSFNLSEE